MTINYMRNKFSPYTLKKSIKNTILMFSIIPLTIAAVIIFVFVSTNQWNRTISRIENVVSKSSITINTSLQRTIDYSTSTTRNKYILNYLDSDLQQNATLNVEFDQYLRAFFDNYKIPFDTENPKFTIYHNNDSILLNRYANNLSELPIEIQDAAKNNKQDTFFWKETSDSVVLYKTFTKLTNHTAILSYTFPLEYFENVISNYTDTLGDDSLEEDLNIGLFVSVDGDDSYIIQQKLISDTTITAKLPGSVKRNIYFENFLIIFMILLCLCAFLITAAKLLSVTMTKKIDDFITNLKEDNLFKRMSDMKIDPSDDFYPVYQNIIALVHKINESHESIQSIEAEKNAIELEYLQSKINPHLLYNSLSSIKWHAVDIGDRSLADNIAILSQYYHNILSKGRSIITINQEIDLTEKYIKVMEFAHSHKYNYTIDIDPQITEFTTVKLILQPFVENSILHGITRQPDGEIKITGKMDNGYIVFEITDNGCGIESAELEKIKNFNYNSDYLSYGIKNTFKRINLYYKNNCAFDIISTPAKGTTIIIKIKALDYHDFYEKYPFLNS